MKISTKGRYALRLMADVAINQGAEKFVPLKEVAERQQISKKYLEQIVLNLSHAGLLLTKGGTQGGYRLAKAPEEYNIKEILTLIEGNLAPVSCLESPVNLCPRKDYCLTLPLWIGLDRVINDYLSAHTLADLLPDSRD